MLEMCNAQVSDHLSSVFFINSLLVLTTLTLLRLAQARLAPARTPPTAGSALQCHLVR